MKHFKLSTKSNLISVADLCISRVPGKEYTSVMKAFANTLNDCHIDYSVIVIEDQTLVAKKIEASWSISE